MKYQQINVAGKELNHIYRFHCFFHHKISHCLKVYMDGKLFTRTCCWSWWDLSLLWSILESDTKSSGHLQEALLCSPGLLLFTPHQSHIKEHSPLFGPCLMFTANFFGMHAAVFDSCLFP